MTTIRFIGDVHGSPKAYRRAVGDAERSIQVGDFGLGFVRMPQLGPGHRFIRGNHDCPDLCRERPDWIADNWRLMLHRHAQFHADFCINERCGMLVCDAMHDARAALRALAACEPSEGMKASGRQALETTASSQWGVTWRTKHEAMGCWRAMLAELVKECERDG